MDEHPPIDTMSLIRRIEVLERQVKEQQELIHDYNVFCSWHFVHVSNATNEDFQAFWKQNRDALKQRALRWKDK